MSELERWNGALLDVLLPTGVNSGQPVVLACDLESVRLAGDALEIAEEDALDELLGVCRRHYEITPLRGLKRVAIEAAGFRNAPRPREVPRWLALLSLTVLAASRMDRSEGKVTHDYYSRLLSLLELPPAPGHPPVPGFEHTRALWLDLAEWLSDDGRGERGYLVVEEGGHRYVGPPVSQTLFRQRDRVVLGRFFARKRANIDAGWDMLTQLRRWGSLHELTNHGADVVRDVSLEPLVRSALRAAYRSWDGSSTDEAGRRLWLAQLRLAASPRGISLWFGCERYTSDVVLEGPARALELPSYPLELEFPLEWLDRLAEGRLQLAVRGRNEAVSFPQGETFLFETSEIGLVHVGAAQDEPVWVLSRDPRFHESSYDDKRYREDLLPSGWTLLASVAPGDLPDELLRRERAGRADIALVGGLRLGPGVYLEGFPPLLRAGALDEETDVWIDGVQTGVLGSFEDFPLAGLSAGAHVIDAGPARFPLELTSRGKREGVGTLRWDIGDAPLYRIGASPEGRGGRSPVGPFSCGALLSGIERPLEPEPLLLRTNATVFCVYGDGDVRGYARPEPAGWMRSVGLPSGASRWRVPDGEKVEWLVVTGLAPRVVRVGTAKVELTGALADLADQYRHAPVQSLAGPEGDVEKEWAELCLALAEFQ